jgi:hypothetical protein
MMDRRSRPRSDFSDITDLSAVDLLNDPSTFKHLDALLLERIAAGATVFTDIYTLEVVHESDRIAAALGADLVNMAGGFRVVENRLQHLKGLGQIVFRPVGGWRMAA